MSNKFSNIVSITCASIVVVLTGYLLFAFTPDRKVAWASDPSTDNPWTTTYEAQPSATDAVGKGDDWIRSLKSDIRKRMAVEHDIGNLSGSPTTDTGNHIEGSARAFYEAACPTVLNRADYDNTGGAGSTALDDGRLCRDSATGELKINSAAGNNWVAAITKFVTPISITGTIDLLGTSAFTNDGLDSMDIHSHAEGANGRHRLTGSSGSWTNAVDGIPFAIQQILVDSTFDAAACTPPPAGALAGQAFGDAGLACLFISGSGVGNNLINFTGRTGNSRVLAIAQILINENSGGVAGCNVSMGIYLDSMAAPISPVVKGSGSTYYGGADYTLTAIGYSSTVSGGATHEIAVHLVGSGSCTASVGQLTVIDLGNTPFP